MWCIYYNQAKINNKSFLSPLPLLVIFIYLYIFTVLFQFLLGVWAKDLNSREDHVKRSVQGKLASATHSQTESYLKPLFRKLRKKVTFVERECNFNRFFSSLIIFFNIMSFRICPLTSKNLSQTSLSSCWRGNMLRFVKIRKIVFFDYVYEILSYMF